MYNANCVISSSSGRKAVEIKRDNQDGTYSVVVFDRDGDGALRYHFGEFCMLEKKISNILES